MADPGEDQWRGGVGGGVGVGYMPRRENIFPFQGCFWGMVKIGPFFVEAPLHATTEEILDLLPLDKLIR